MSNFKLHPDLQGASLERACAIANELVMHNDARVRPGSDPGQLAADLSYMLEYLRLNFVLIPRDPPPRGDEIIWGC